MKLILGHNQFIGISHTSETKSMEFETRFSAPNNIMDVVEAAYQTGIRSMIVETHPRMLDFLEYYHAANTIDMELILQIPNVQTYVRDMSSKGPKGIIKGIVKETKPSIMFKGALRSLKDVILKNYIDMGATGLEFIASEYMKYDIGRVMIHNVLTDFLCALDMTDVLITIKERMHSDYGIDTGFITLNLPMLLNSIKKYELPSLDIMTPINPLGFDMNPSKEEVEESVKSTNHKIIAMNVLGGGSIDIRDSANYIKKLNHVQECVIGSSNPLHISEAYANFIGQEMPVSPAHFCPTNAILTSQ